MAAMKRFSCDRCGETRDLEQIGAGTLCFSCQKQDERERAARGEEVEEALLMAVLWLRNLFSRGNAVVKDEMILAIPDPDIGLFYLNEVMMRTDAWKKRR